MAELTLLQIGPAVVHRNIMCFSQWQPPPLSLPAFMSFNGFVVDVLLKTQASLKKKIPKYFSVCSLSLDTPIILT